MDTFAIFAPDWTGPAVHAHSFCCPTCRRTSVEGAKNV